MDLPDLTVELDPVLCLGLGFGSQLSATTVQPRRCEIVLEKAIADALRQADPNSPQVTVATEPSLI